MTEQPMPDSPGVEGVPVFISATSWRGVERPGPCEDSPTGWAAWEYYEAAPGRLSSRCTCREVPAPSPVALETTACHPPQGTTPGTKHRLIYGPSGAEFIATWTDHGSWLIDGDDDEQTPTDLWRDSFYYEGPSK